QAEDGIRDFHVTGVQTCALPISAILYPELANASSLKPEVVAGLDILIVRELTGDIYFGQPRGVRTLADGPFAGDRQGYDTMHYRSEERRVGKERRCRASAAH